MTEFSPIREFKRRINAHKKRMIEQDYREGWKLWAIAEMREVTENDILEVLLERNVIRMSDVNFVLYSRGNRK